MPLSRLNGVHRIPRFTDPDAFPATTVAIAATVDLEKGLGDHMRATAVAAVGCCDRRGLLFEGGVVVGDASDRRRILHNNRKTAGHMRVAAPKCP